MESNAATDNIWSRASFSQRAGLAIGIVAIAAIGIALAMWSFDKQYRVLFSQLDDAEAAAIVERLKAEKTPYRLADNGRTVLVPAESIHEVRLALVAEGAPIGGGVGFEIFDDQGLGATEQSQRVSYQRALQGELARTIAALDDVRRARVHLVLPESTLFERDRQEPRAAVTLNIHSGTGLEREQIAGVQRLVAASVAGLDPAKVVVTDQRGITLSGALDIGAGGAMTGGRLQMKRDTEQYVTRKVVELLDRAFGPGQAMVSVDVTLNFDEVTRTVQDLRPAGVRRVGARRHCRVCRSVRVKRSATLRGRSIPVRRGRRRSTRVRGPSTSMAAA